MVCRGGPNACATMSRLSSSPPGRCETTNKIRPFQSRAACRNQSRWSSQSSGCSRPSTGRLVIVRRESAVVMFASHNPA